MDKTTLGDRMKSYERLSESKLLTRVPVIIRLDGKGFSKLTKKMKKPFDETFIASMERTTVALCSAIPGCMLGYTQSDEISLVLRNDQSLESQPWFDNRVQKLCSVTASIATAAYNQCMTEPNGDTCAHFDSRVFVVPSITEACNYLIWRQQDCTRNSILSATYWEIAALEDYGKKQARKLMHGLKSKEQQELLFKTTGKNWNDYPEKQKRGIALRREVQEASKVIDGRLVEGIRMPWVVNAPPIFSSEEGWKWMLEALGVKEEGLD